MRRNYKFCPENKSFERVQQANLKHQVCYDHSTGTKAVDLLCITGRRWFAHFRVHENFKKEWNLSIVIHRLSPLEHVIEILAFAFKGRNLRFWVSGLAQAHRVGCLLQPRGAVGKTSISGARDSCWRRFNPRLLILIFVFSVPAWILTGNAPIV